MIRATTYANKPPDNWFTLLQALSEKTFFLMSRNGPTVFKIRDEEDKMFKITLGNPHTCNCEDFIAHKYCVHILYCVIKVLRVDKNHSLAYQTSYTDKELDQVLSGQCAQAGGRRQIPTTHRLTRNLGLQSSIEGNESDTNQETAAPLSPLKKPHFPAAGTDKVKRRELLTDEENICPICQDDLKEEQLLTWCRRGCGANLHANCMMKYHQHKTSTHQETTCPLCRENWDINLLKYDCQMKKTQFSDQNTPICEVLHCQFCKCIIRSRFYRCLECSQKPGHNPVDGSLNHFLDYCNDCYQSNRVNSRHQSHHFMLSDASVERVKDVTWVPCKGPFITSASAAAAAALMNNPLLAELQNRELTNNDYDLLLQLDEHQHIGSISQSLLSILPSITPLKLQQILQRQQQALSTISDSANDIAASSKICWCDNRGLHDLSAVELLCGHTAHTLCIKEDVEVIIRQDISQLLHYRCAHGGCGKIVFRCLQRKKRRTQKKNLDEKQSTGSVTASSDQNQEIQHLNNLLPISGAIRSHALATSSLPALNMIIGTRLEQSGNNGNVPALESVGPTIGRRTSVQPGGTNGSSKPTKETIRLRVMFQRHREEALANDPNVSSSILNVGVNRLSAPNNEAGFDSGTEEENSILQSMSENSRFAAMPQMMSRKGIVVGPGKLRPMIGRKYQSNHNNTVTSPDLQLTPIVTNLGIAAAVEMSCSEILPTAVVPLYRPTASSTTSNHVDTIRTLKRLDTKMQLLNQQRQTGLQALDQRFDSSLQLSVTPLQSSRSQPQQISGSNLLLTNGEPNLNNISNENNNNHHRMQVPNLNSRAVRRGSVVINSKHVRKVTVINNSNNTNNNENQQPVDNSNLSLLMNINHYLS